MHTTLFMQAVALCITILVFKGREGALPCTQADAALVRAALLLQAACSLCVCSCGQVKIEKPIMRIPMLAIHLNRDIMSKGFELNKQTHLVPMLASAVKKAANKAAGAVSNGGDGSGIEIDGQNKKQKVDGAGDAADLTPKTAKVGCLPHACTHVELLLECLAGSGAAAFVPPFSKFA